MEQSMIRYIWRHTAPQQIWILCIVLVSMVPYFLSFDLPKQIVNGPITGDGFATADATQLFMRIAVTLPGLGEVLLFPGIELGRIETLFALSLVFLGLVIVNGLFKLYINTYKGRLGERLLRRLRYDLIDRILRFPPAVFKRMKGAEVASMIKDEVEPMGGFTGDSFVSPALLGGQALTALIFIFVQNLWLGLITAFMVSIQALLIPRMRRRLLVLGRERQLTARELSGRVSEIVDGIGSIHGYDTTNYERADVASRLARIFKIRFDIYQWKFMVKFINNFLASLTPFLFYSVGGYLALQGRLDIGQLVAVIAAYKDLPGPLKDLIDWDQARQDTQIKYAMVVSQFDIDPLIDADLHRVADRGDPLPLPLAAVNLTITDDGGTPVLEHVTMKLEPGETVGLIGGEALAEALARIAWPSGGKITCGDTDILALPESMTGRGISYAASDGYFFFGTLRDNLLYRLKHAPLHPVQYQGEAARRRAWERLEAGRAGTPDLDLGGDWIDYTAAGAKGAEDLLPQILPVLDAVQLSKDLLDLALRSVIDPTDYGDLADRVVAMRRSLYQALDRAALQGLIVSFEPDAYNTEATVGENLLLGNAIGAVFSRGTIGINPYFRSVMVKHGLHRTLFEMGYEIATNAIELFGDLPPDHPFFQQLTFMTADDIPRYQQLLNKLEGQGFDKATQEERAAIIGLSFAYVEPRHRFGLLTAELMAKIVDFRRQFRLGLPSDLHGAIEFYDPDKYTHSASLMDNVLFGRISQKTADGGERIAAIVRELIVSEGLYTRVLGIGLDFHVGAGGKRLSAVQRQKLNLARALLGRSAYVVLNRPLASVEQRTRDQIMADVLALLKARDPETGVIWVLSDTAQARALDRIVVFQNGVLAEDGSYETLVGQNGVFKQLATA